MQYYIGFKKYDRGWVDVGKQGNEVGLLEWIKIVLGYL
jgi:hypothetical protein